MKETLQERLTRHEGFCSTPYRDTLGNWTVGFGHFISKAECDNYPDGITYIEAEALLENDINNTKKNCAKEFPWLLGLDEIRQEIIWEMAYQIGVGGVAQFHNMIAAIRDKDWDRASKEMLNSKWHSQTPARCEELANIMRDTVS